ncbi:response regulator transcription factor [Nocardioides sp. GY 10113]|uniref:response regulator n=1 Tax=Nocardioides sp. GY 10113 TaxID=2569761 RepID=UPI0010A807FF|nr:response regulator transcription factor [Nocardioides sp. GY 10113]TIC88971.1 response regulator transcription factor [Nocardioides sp. GY 10113]
MAAPDGARSVRVLIVDDHPIFRDGLRTALSGTDELVVVGEAGDVHAALAAVDELGPDVVLMDLNMPGTNGIEGTRLVRARAGCAVLVLTMQSDDDSVYAAVRAGAAGYLLKGADRGEVIRAVVGVANGEAVFGPQVAARMLAHLSGEGPARGRPFPQLTERERDVLDLVARGLGNQAIAHRLSLSPKTVRNNVSTILGKLHAVDRAEAIERARDQGLGEPGPR